LLPIGQTIPIPVTTTRDLFTFAPPRKVISELL
jgi:hypothetical protein